MPIEKQIKGLYDSGLIGGYITWNANSSISNKKIVDNSNLEKDIVKLILTTIVCIATIVLSVIYKQDDMISTFGVVILGVVFVLYIGQEVVKIMNEIKYGEVEEDNTQLKGEAYKKYKQSPQFKKDIFKTIFYYILGGFAVYIGATLLCDNGQKLAVDFLGIDPIVV